MPTPYTPNILDAPDDELVCYCGRVSKGRVRQAVAQGARTLPTLIKAVGACLEPRCEETNPRGRCCCKELAALLRAFDPEGDPDAPLPEFHRPRGPVLG